MIRFGTLGAAKITPAALIYPCMNEFNAQIVSVAARDRARAEQFAKAHHIPRVFDSYSAVIDDEKADAVYVPLPITAHHEWCMKALAAGKHVLCEKSMAANADQAIEMNAAAVGSGLVLMDAFHYRYHPLFGRVREIYQSGLLGQIRTIDAVFHVPVTDKNDIRMNYETGGGVTMDIGCYPISWVRHLTDKEPKVLSAVAEVGPPEVDVMLNTEMTIGDIRVTTSGDMRSSVKFRATLTVVGDQGEMRVHNVIAPQFGSQIELIQGDANTVETFDRRPTYAYQLDAFLDAVEHGSALATDGSDAVKQMQVIDACYAAAGLRKRGE